MEIQQTLKLMVHHHNRGKENNTPKLKWRKIFTLQRSPPSSKPIQTPPPEEFICPISGNLMADPVIVSSGHSFERASVQSCKDLNFTPQLSDGTTPDFSTVIPNLALKSAISKWCHASSTLLPQPPHRSLTDNLVRTLIFSSSSRKNNANELVGERMLTANPSCSSSSSSVESIATSASSSTPPAQLTAKPSFCYSSPSSSELEPTTPEAEEFISKLRSNQVFLIEESLQNLRKLTRTNEDSRITLCTQRMLSSLRGLVASKYKMVQVNAVACVVNLSLEKTNKVRIVRSGLVPPLIEALRVGSSEAQEHASGALFSLALEDDNKTAIGVLGALPPLIHALRVGTERTRHDSALALYHLSMVQSNRTKLVKIGSVPVLVGMVKSGQMTGRVLMILGNLGCGPDGRAAMLDVGMVECLVGLLAGSESVHGSIKESCVAVLYVLSHGGLRFKALAKAAGVVEALEKAEKEVGSQRAKEKARRVFEMMKGKEEEEEEDVDWEELLDSGLGSRSHNQHDGEFGGLNGTTSSSEF
ncbi:U-box domain-containing protein 40 [Arachis ipaensis]|uniref:RING-type E3 ubiquitin transferase n=1 Tax=Arachis hypogaea TaxID=3818 RepID=A0A444Z2B9_ARAHY|nr:U-box domain-containing protein 40 [Arachis ipaensis]QHO12732.1 U-box domain-containing protein [Arachis hypogaea]RYR08343.1 hypothetical protein Ahy_B05g075988 [Arachis hypogaea]